ncbi:beta-galactosidase [Sinomonas terrae]|uniref:beta-galactosidase n=1 Tax=Sinomonas terrae TaxID=2908838 RepID=A0ABS9U788_9MICC|nr:beta-galactosidase [Sinomonas terrae]MCH6472105.1 beta-galactosidase [Sinomonas terrae]
MLFGASYYHEYMPIERLEKDLDLMVEAGFTVIRVGESTWASYEPRNGEIGFEALTRVVDRAHAHGLKVIVGTPTYAIPPWLAREYPEVMAQTSNTHTLPYGARQNVDFTSPAYLFHAERLLRRMGAHFADRPGVIGFQVDNEIGVHRLANPQVLERFRRHVMARLGGVEGANEKWGLTYWSHRLSEQADLWAPDGNTNPGYALEWERFQASLTVDFLKWQRDLLREYISPDQFVIHDLIGGHSAPSTDIQGISEIMDQTAVNIYVPMQKALELPEPELEGLYELLPGLDAGTWSALWRSDMAYSLRGPHGSRFLVTEAQASSLGGPAANIPPFPGQLRMMAHLVASRGADMLAYWHWHSLHYGGETYWGGVLGHDLEPNRIYDEVADLGAELKLLTPELKDAVPDADIAILYSRDSLKALDAMPALAQPGTPEPDHSSYHRIFTRFYQGAVDEGLQVRIVHPDSDWSHHRVLIVPALYIADDALLERIKEHARAGGHVVLTFRSGYADEWARVRWERQPALLRTEVGASYQEFTNLPTPVALRALAVDGVPDLVLPAGALAEGWADGMKAENAAVLSEYADPYLGAFAAATTNAVGSGRMTWIGTLPDRASAAAILQWAVRERGISPVADEWTVRPDSVRITSAVRPDGRRLWFAANHSHTPVRLPVPQTLSGLVDLGKPERAVGPDVELGAWDSRVLIQEQGE